MKKTDLMLDAIEWTEEAPGGIEMLPISLLYPHPNNPRKELGDLTELTASIKRSGVMQNLTVVDRAEGGYTVIIGHRRCAAARLAGLKELPCVVADLDEREQMGIMLAENMQRVDLTVVEQAESIQLMLDLGESLETVSEKTGLAKKTVQERLKLNKLDKKALTKAVNRQVSLTDLLKISRLEDEAAREKVLAAAGTNNFNDVYKAAVSDQETKKSLAHIVAVVSSWAFEKPSGIAQEGYKWRGFISVRDSEKRIEEVLRKYQSEYAAGTPCYSLERSGLAIYSRETADEKKTRREGEKARERSAQLEALRDELWEECKRYYELRMEWVKDARFTLEDVNELMQDLVYFEEQHYNSYYYQRDAIADVICKNGEKKNDAYKRYAKRAADLIFVKAYGEFNDSEKSRPYNWEWKNGHYRVTFSELDPTHELYRFLVKWGYELSDGEKAMLEGSHPAYLACKEWQEREYGEA